MKKLALDSFQKGAALMTVEKVVKMFSHLVMAILLARHLGPEQFGALNFAYAFVTLFLFINTLGLEAVLVNRFVKNPEQQQNWFNLGLSLRLIAGVVCVALIVLVGYLFLQPSQLSLVFVLAFVHIFMPFSLYEYYMQAIGEASKVAILLMLGHIATLLLRIFLVLTDAELVWFAAAYVFDFAIVAIFYLIFIRKIRFTLAVDDFPENAKSLLKESLPLIFSGMVVLLYMKMDQIMIGMMSGEAEVGIYTAATKLSESWYFFGLTIIAAMFPKYIAKMNAGDEQGFYSGLVSLTRLLFLGALLLALTVWLSSDWIIMIFYGSGYEQSSAVLSISIFAVPFVYLGAIASRILIYDNKSKTVLVRSATGFLINFSLNFMLIPSYGSTGAAFATVISQFFVGVIFSVISNSFKLSTFLKYFIYTRHS